MSRAILLLATLLMATLLVPLASASHGSGTTWTFTTAYGELPPTLQDIVRAPQAGIADSGWGCPGPQQTPVSLNAGEKYFAVVSGFSTNLTVRKSGSNDPIFSLSHSTYYDEEPGWNLQVVWRGVDVSDSASQHIAVAFTPTESAAIYVTCTINSIRAYNIPNGAIGFVGASYTSGTTRLLPVFKDVPVQGEAGILAGQTSKSPANSKFSWARLNQPVTFAKMDGVGTGGNVADIAQSFPAPTGGGYIEVTRIGVFGSGTYTCSGNLRISITNTLSVPWNDAGEAAAVHVEWSLSGTAPTSNYVTVDWVTATISEDSGSVSLGTPTWSIGGNPVSGENLKALAPYITPSQGTYYVRAFWDQGSCGSSAYVMSRYSGCDCYSGGTAWYVSNGAWTQSPSQDLGGLLLNAYGGNKTYEWRLNATPTNIGGAAYLYIGEHLRDSNTGLATPQTSWGGSALGGKDLYELAGGAGSTECTFAGIGNSQCLLREYRLGHNEIPFNTTEALTVTINMNGMGRNLVYVGTLVNQPTMTHIQMALWDNQEMLGNDLVIYQVWSTDDYFALAEFTVKECANTDCTEVGIALSDVSYFASICNGIRTAAGTPDITGKFNVSGQDLPGCSIKVTLTGNGYAETTWTAEITSPGTHRFTIGIFKAGASSGSAQLAATTITFEGNTSVHVPERLNVTITRGRSAPLFIGLDRVEPTTGLVQHNVITATYWKQSDSNAFQFYYPSRAKSTSAEQALYILWVMNETGVVLNHQKLFILPQGGSTGDYDVSVTADMIRGIEKAGYISAQQTFQSQHQASLLATQKSVRDQVYEDFQKISEYGWFVLGFLLFLATVRAFRR